MWLRRTPNATIGVVVEGPGPSTTTPPDRQGQTAGFEPCL